MDSYKKLNQKRNQIIEMASFFVLPIVSRMLSEEIDRLIGLVRADERERRIGKRINESTCPSLGTRYGGLKN